MLIFGKVMRQIRRDCHYFGIRFWPLISYLGPILLIFLVGLKRLLSIDWSMIMINPRYDAHFPFLGIFQLQENGRIHYALPNPTRKFDQ